MANSDGGGLIGKCASVWDGLMCWPDTKSGETAYQNCTNDYVKSKVQVSDAFDVHIRFIVSFFFPVVELFIRFIWA